MHWKFLSCREYGSGTGPTANSMKSEKMPEIGPPMGETGSCISYNYLGSSKLDPLTAYVRCWDPHWCMRKITTSLGKALRAQFKKTHLWRSSHELIFCSFKKTYKAMTDLEHVKDCGQVAEHADDGPSAWNFGKPEIYATILEPILLIALETSASDTLVSLGLYNYVVLVRFALGAPESGFPESLAKQAAPKVLERGKANGILRDFVKKYAVAHALVARIHTATQYMNSTQSCVDPGTKMGLWLQLWVDEMLDLAYHTFLGNLLVKDQLPPDPPDSSEEETLPVKVEPHNFVEFETKETVHKVGNRMDTTLIDSQGFAKVKDEPKSDDSLGEEEEEADWNVTFSGLFGSSDDSQEFEFETAESGTRMSDAIVQKWVNSFITKREKNPDPVPVIKSEPCAKDQRKGIESLHRTFVPDINTSRLVKNDERSQDSECGVRCDKELLESGAMFMLRPHGRRFVTIGEIFDVSELLIRGNIWREIRPTTKDFLAHMIHFLMSKPRLHKCLIRNIEDILQFYCEQNPLLGCLVKDLVHITMMGNFPRARHRPGFMARMFLRRDNLAFFRADEETTMTWFAENRQLVYYTLKEFYLYLVSLSPAIEEIMIETQWHAEHSTGIRKCMDEVRMALDKSYTKHYYSGIDSTACKKLLRGADGKISFEIGTGLNLAENVRLDGKVLGDIRGIIKRVHNSQLKYITKLRKGSFAQVLASEMRSWYSREDHEKALHRFRTGQLAEESMKHMSSPETGSRKGPNKNATGLDAYEDAIDEDSDEDLGKQILDPSLQVIERSWKDHMPLVYEWDTSGHNFKTRIPLTEVIEYMYGTDSEEEEEQDVDGDFGRVSAGCNTTDDEDSDALVGEEADDENLQTIYKEELIRRLTDGMGGAEDAQQEKIVKQIEESGLIGKMVLVDPDDFLSQDERNAIYLVAQMAKTRYDGPLWN